MISENIKNKYKKRKANEKLKWMKVVNDQKQKKPFLVIFCLISCMKAKGIDLLHQL